MKSLALKYRPQRFSDVVEQDGVKAILQNQLDTKEIKQAYLFVGAAGTGKTTSARIFANEINHFEGLPIEMDAASNNSVDNVREITKMAQTKSIDGEYKIFILDEVHMFSAGAWAAMLKLIEEPPAKTIFILCTTDYWKIPKTILSRCQRYDFKRISTEAIRDRLQYIYLEEMKDEKDYLYEKEALDFIARQSDGCLRDAVTKLDQCMSYGDVTVDNVLKTLGEAPLQFYMDLVEAVAYSEHSDIIKLVEHIHAEGYDLKQFVKGLIDFVIDIIKVDLTDGSFDYTHLPNTPELREWMKSLHQYFESWRFICEELPRTLIQIDADIKWSQSPKAVIEARLLTV